MMKNPLGIYVQTTEMMVDALFTDIQSENSMFGHLLNQLCDLN